MDRERERERDAIVVAEAFFFLFLFFGEMGGTESVKVGTATVQCAIPGRSQVGGERKERL